MQCQIHEFRAWMYYVQWYSVFWTACTEKGEINAVVSLTKEFQLRTLILSEHIIDAMNGIIKKKYF